MAKVTIEGSILPCSDLPRGERRTVTVTDHVRRLVDRGFVFVVSGSLDEPAEKPAKKEAVVKGKVLRATKVDEKGRPIVSAVPNADPPVKVEGSAPGEGATRAEWATFLESKGVTFPDTSTTADLKAGWESIEQQRHGGS